MTETCNYCLDVIAPGTYKIWKGIKYCGYMCKNRATTIRYGIRYPDKMPKTLHEEDRAYIKRLGGVRNVK